MTGNTHWAVGTASALCMVQPQGIKEWAICVGVAAVGSVIPDIDISTSDSRATLNRITILSVLAVVVLGFVEFKWNLNVVDNLSKQNGVTQALIGLTMMLVVCTFGKNQPHRTFMHSIPVWIALNGIVYFIHPILMPPFAVAMLSHIVIDLLNRKKIKLFYPLKWGICFNLCTAGGRVNQVMGYAATGLALILSVKSILML